MAQSSASRTETWQISFKESLLLIGLLVPVVLYCVAAKIDCRCGGKPEAGAWSSLRTLTTVTEEFRRRFQIYPLALTDLSDEALQPRPYIDSALGFGIKNGYTYTYLSTAMPKRCCARC